MAASIMDFSPSGEFFAFCGPDGTLRVWETSSNSLKQEYVPSSHLSATCTCLKWQTGRKIVQTPSRKKRKSVSNDSNSTGNSSDLIALGTSSGSILVYSISHGELQGQWDNGHDTNVNDISWSRQDGFLFSCASDTYIIQWNVQDGTIMQKIKADGPVFSICLCNNDSNLLSASRSISLWDLNTCKVIQTFTGHITEVFRLLDVPNSADQLQNMYFLSAARDDRFIQVWRTKGKKTKGAQTALATLHLPEGAISMTFHGPLVDGAYLFSVVTLSGHFLLFREVLNGECKELIKPKAKLQIASSDSDVPRQLPVFSAQIVDKDSVLLSYGNTLKPTFEKITYGGLKPENCLIREDKTEKVSESGEASKIKTPVVNDDVKVLTPGHLVPSKPTQSQSSGSGKKKRQRLTSIDMTVEERLDVMGLAESKVKPSLQTTSSAVLLAQGLQSQDASILNHVLQNSNPVFIRNTIRKLPIPLVIPLVDELSRRMQGHAQGSKNTISWTKSLLTIHSSYLMTFPELVQNLSLLYQMMDSRVTMFSRLSRLEGKLELILSQVSDQSPEEPTENIEALVTLQDESSDEDMLIPGEEEEVNWESEMDEEDEAMEEDDDDDEDEDDSKEMEDDDDDEDEEESKELEEDDSDDEINGDQDSPEDDDDEG